MNPTNMTAAELAAWEARQRGLARGRTYRPCKVCHTEFETQISSTRTTCGKECSATAKLEHVRSCTSCHQVIPRYPCQRCRTHRRDPRIARAVIARDGRCWACGTTENHEGAHIIAKAHGGPDTMANMRAECFALNRTGRCK